MKPTARALVSSLLVMSTLLPRAASAAASPSYTLVKDTIASGGQYASSANYQQQVGVLGAYMGGFMSSAAYQLEGGFAQTLGVRPIIFDLTPHKPTKPYVDEELTIVADARDPQQQTLEYRFWVGGVIIQDWSTNNKARWTPSLGDLGRQLLRVLVRDPDDHQSARVASVYVIRRPITP